MLDTREAKLPVDTRPLGPPHQLLMDGIVLDTREAELPVDTGPLGPPHQLLLDGVMLDTRDFTIFVSVLDYYLELYIHVLLFTPT